MEYLASKLRSNPRCIPFYNQNNPFFLGKGISTNPDLVIVFDYPTLYETNQNSPFASAEYTLINDTLQKNGIDTFNNVYWTYLFKCRPYTTKHITLKNMKDSINILASEICCLQPKFVLCIGRYSSTSVIGCELNCEYITNSKLWNIETHKTEKKYAYKENDFYNISMKSIEGITQRIYFDKLNKTFWSLGISNPHHIISMTNIQQKEKALDIWIKNFEEIQIYLKRPLPISDKQIDMNIQKEFQQKHIIPTKPSDVLKRLNKNTDEKDQYYTNSLETLEFQVTKIEYNNTNNEYCMFGKLDNGDSIYCAVPHAKEDRIFHFYVKYPKSWRIKHMSKYHDHPQFDYEKDYDEETNNHEYLLKCKENDLKQRLKQKLEETKCNKYDQRIFTKSSIQSPFLKELYNGSFHDNILDEVCDLKLTRVFKYPFKSFDTQKKPRIKVELKFQPILPWVLACIQDMVDEKVQFYEIDCTSVQRFTLHNNIYVGGWVQIEPKKYQIITTKEEEIRKSSCDLEIVTFLQFIKGHNPNYDLELNLKSDALLDISNQIRKEIQEQSSIEQNNKEKYTKWLEIQNRRLIHINQKIDNICKERCIDDPTKGFDSKLKKWSRNAPMKILVMDIEVMTNGRTFPSAEYCPIISIVAYVQTIDKNIDVDRNSGITTWDEIAWFSLGPIDIDRAYKERMDDTTIGKPKEFNIYCFQSEKELLEAWLLFRSDRDPDMEIGHNIEFFDLPYLKRRCELSGAYDKPLLGKFFGTKLYNEKISIRERSTFSRAFGAKKQKIIQIPGCSCLDTMSVFQKEEKLSSYSLNSLALEKFGDKKVDLPYVAIPGTFYKDRNRLLLYNDKDTNITIRLLLYKDTVISSTEFVKLAGVFPPQDCYSRGQQFKVLSAILRSIVNDGNHYIIESSDNDVENMLNRLKHKKYNWNQNDDIEILEFDYELDDPETELESNEETDKTEKNKRKHIDIEYSEDELDGMETPDTSEEEIEEKIELENKRQKTEEIQDIDTIYKFSRYITKNVKDQSEIRKKPLKLVKEKKKSKKKKYTKKEIEKRERDIKTNKKIGDFFNIQVSDAHTLRSLEKKIRKKRKLSLKEIEESETVGAAYKGATCIEPRRGFHIYKDNETGKWKGVFVLCCDFSSLYPTVDIANNFCHDKKLFVKKLNKLKIPIEFCHASTEKWPDPKNNYQDSYAFFVQSDFRNNVLHRCKDYSNELKQLYDFVKDNPKWKHVISIYKRCLYYWDKIDSLDDKDIFCPISEDYVPEIAKTEEFTPDIYHPKKNIQTDLDDVLMNFWEDDFENDTNMYPSRGILPKYLMLCLQARKLVKAAMKKSKPGSAEYKSADGVQLSYKITANSGYGVTGTMTGKLGDYAISSSITGYGRRYLEFVKNVFLKGDGKTYVFEYIDKETGEIKKENFVFKGGDNYGGDTDSFFNSIHGVDYDMVERMGKSYFEKNMQILADLVNALLPDPVKLLFEKIMYPFLSVNKKRYAYIDFNRKQICLKGLEAARRDNVSYLRNMQMNVFKLLLMELNIDGAIEYVISESKKLVEGQVPIDSLIYTKQYYKTDYKVETLPHLIVIKKKKHRGDTPIEIGQRVPYVMVKGTSDIKKASLNAEDPSYALENDLALDYDHYLEKQIKKPMSRIFARIPGIETEKQAQKILFSNLTRKKILPTLQQIHPIYNYVQTKYNCILCGKKTFEVCCDTCFTTQKKNIDIAIEDEVKKSVKRKRNCIDTCKNCLNQDEDEIYCDNTHCPEYMPRKKSIADWKKATKKYGIYRNFLSKNK